MSILMETQEKVCPGRFAQSCRCPAPGDRLSPPADQGPSCSGHGTASRQLADPTNKPARCCSPTREPLSCPAAGTVLCLLLGWLLAKNAGKQGWLDSSSKLVLAQVCGVSKHQQEINQSWEKSCSPLSLQRGLFTLCTAI